MRRRLFAILMIFAVCASFIGGCRSGNGEEEVIDDKPVTLIVAGGWPDCRACDEVAALFHEKYPNCTIEYEYLQDYSDSLETRLGSEETVDLFFTSNIQVDSRFLPYAYDVNSSSIDLSDTFDGLIQNFTFREESMESKKLYAVPLGAEMRGMYVNKTLLDSLNIAVPTNQQEVLNACHILKENGYIPFHGNPGSFAQTLLYPWICNLIANAPDPEAAYTRVNACEPGLSEMFTEPYEFIYLLVENGYYDYKTAQTELNLFNESTDQDYARYFFNIAGENDQWQKKDDLGQIAFMPSPMSLLSTMEKTKEDYHSLIEYCFIPAPIGPDGGYAYLSPAHGIAVNKNSGNLDWCVRFLNFLFEEDTNKVFAEAFHVIPNTKDSFAYIRDVYDVPDDHISHLGQVTFDYGFYDMVQPSLIDISKANNPKYMKDNGDGTQSLYPLQFYIDELEESISAQ